jgi:hypothetical protein
MPCPALGHATRRDAAKTGLLSGSPLATWSTLGYNRALATYLIKPVKLAWQRPPPSHRLASRDTYHSRSLASCYSLETWTHTMIADNNGCIHQHRNGSIATSQHQPPACTYPIVPLPLQRLRHTRCTNPQLHSHRACVHCPPPQALS